jgi:hypothetical protein
MDFGLRRASGEGWTYVEPEPKSSFKEYGETLIAGDGSSIEVGWVDIEWDYGDYFFSGTEMYQFLQFCPGASATVQVRTKTREVTSAGYPVFRNYTAEMYRPESEFKTVHGIQYFSQVVIRFKGGAEVT